MLSVTCVAPVNIAVIKYWGKRNEELILPLNDSLSATLSTDQMCAKTTIAASPAFKENRIWLNGMEECFNNPRLLNCLNELKLRANQSDNSNKLILDFNIHVCSENNFPTAAGLASSAAGYACFVYALANLYNIHDCSEISSIARIGSGSACRSIYGGFVQWKMGESQDGHDSFAIQITPSTHWDEMRIVILVVNDKQKKTSSTGGMSRSVRTSELLKYRVKECVPKRISSIIEAIHSKDFTAFSDITMRDSNQFHAVCLDTYPPCVYMNDVSHSIVDFVHQYNAVCGENKVAYTFDAGPNAVLYLLEKDVPEVVSLVNKIFPSDNLHDVEYIKGIPVDLGNVERTEDILSKLSIKPRELNLLKFIIHTKVGEGPKCLDQSQSLLSENGLPK